MLTTAKCRNAELREKVYKLIDSDGLMLKVYPGGAKTSVVRHCIGGKDKEHRIGEFPHMTLVEARKARYELKARLRSGESEELEPLTFHETMQRWLDVKTSARKYDDKYLYTITHRLEKFVLPELGDIPISEIKRRKVMAVLDDIVREGHGETASRVAELIQQVFVFALR